jgi:hypothetical protein
VSNPKNSDFPGIEKSDFPTTTDEPWPFTRGSESSDVSTEDNVSGMLGILDRGFSALTSAGNADGD